RKKPEKMDGEDERREREVRRRAMKIARPESERSREAGRPPGEAPGPCRTASGSLFRGLLLLAEETADAPAQDQLGHRYIALEEGAGALVDHEVGPQALVERLPVRTGVERVGDEQPAAVRELGHLLPAGVAEGPLADQLGAGLLAQHGGEDL